MAQQLALNIELPIHHTLQNFYGGGNEITLYYLHYFLHQQGDLQVYLWGEQGSGKTHLLQGCCHELFKSGYKVSYIPLNQHTNFSPQILNGLEQLDLVCFDDIQDIAKQPLWEEALFHCYNRLREQKVRLIVSGQTAPAQLPLELADLQSRLAAGPVFHLQTLDDDGKLIALQQHAHARGLELSSEVAQFLLSRCPRSIHQLFNILEQLDKASLAAQRKLTIPFIKTVLALN